MSVYVKHEDRKIKYGEEQWFGMFSDEGNEKVYMQLLKIADRANKHNTLKRRDLAAAIDGMEKTAIESGYTEVTDTEVRIHVSRWLNINVNKPNGWVLIDYFYEDYYGSY
jgi:hypothetical protein